MISLKIKKLSEDAILPKRNHDTDMGLDLYSLDEYKLAPRCNGVISTGLAIQYDVDKDIMPLFIKCFNLGFFVRGCSGNFVKKGFQVIEGTIDKDYQGQIGVMCRNTSNEEIIIEKGKKIAQAVFLFTPKISNIEVVEDFVATDRGEKGFGETSGTI
ncbi:MAG: dUTP diphosphatase [Elusimicrobiota bacterium]|jgi:dUTP pyrophosphatase|nr:dUTP diphosphatase [Elusimicrobiota bacterium]